MKQHEAINGLFAGIQPIMQQDERSATRSCSAECFGLVEKRTHGKCEKHDDNLYACSSTSQTSHPPLVFTSNTLDSSDINPLGFALGIYAWTVSCIMGN